MIIEWDDNKYMQYRNDIFYRHAGVDWISCRADTVGSRTVLIKDFPSGKTGLTLNPSYGFDDLEDYIRTISGNGMFEIGTLFETPKGKRDYLLKAGYAQSERRKGSVLMTARTHPYETAGSFCIEGMIEELMALYNTGMNPLKERDVIFILMIYPDGVEQGCCKLSAPDGVDLSRTLDGADLFTRILTGLIDETRPALFVELHNWMIRGTDGFFYLNAWDGYRLRHMLRKRIPRYAYKPIAIGLDRFLLRGAPEGLKRYARDVHGTKVMTAEFGWHGRSPTDMKGIGRVLYKCITRII